MAKNTKKSKKKVTLRSKTLATAGFLLADTQKKLLMQTQILADGMYISHIDLLKSLLPRANSIEYHLKKVIADRLEDEMLAAYNQTDLDLGDNNAN